MGIVKAVSGIRRIQAISSQTTWKPADGMPDGFHVNGDGYVDIMLAGPANTWVTLYVVGGIQHNFELQGLRPAASHSPVASGLFAVWQ